METDFVTFYLRRMKELKEKDQMETLEELDRNAHLRAAAVQPMIDELRYINRQMEEHNARMVVQAESIVSLLIQIRDRL